MLKRYKDRKKYKTEELYIVPVRRIKDLVYKPNGRASLKSAFIEMAVVAYKPYSSYEVIHIERDLLLPVVGCDHDVVKIGDGGICVLERDIIKFTDYFYSIPELSSKKKITGSFIKALNKALTEKQKRMQEEPEQQKSDNGFVC